MSERSRALTEDRRDDDLGARLRVAERSIAATVADGSRAQRVRSGHKGRSLVTGLVGLAETALAGAVLIVVVAVVTGWRPGTAASPILPQGLFTPEQVSGTASVEADTCVALSLAADAMTTGRATVYWWAPGSTGCGTRDSSIMTQGAALQAVALAASGTAPARQGYRLTFSVALVPSGNHDITLTLDPYAAAQIGVPLVALRAGDSAASLTFTRADRLDIPGTGPDHSPVAAPTS